MLEEMAVNTRLYREIVNERLNEENITTVTSEEQIKVESSVANLYEVCEHLSALDPDVPVLMRTGHISFLKKCLTHLTSGYQSLDASRPWLCYWILHSLELLEANLQTNEISSIAQFLKRCQSPQGGFGGGPGQIPHLAPTYAAVNALCILGTEEAYEVIDREKLQEFLWSLKQPNGSFEMHKEGEIDVRGVYCAVSIARLTNIYTEELFQNSGEWTASCQTYEGGFSGYPGMEAHGGYAFCGLAALALLNKDHLCDIQSFLKWIVNKQMRFEGGFQGRTNKLVDGCYSFWQGGCFPLVHKILSKYDVNNIVDAERWLFHQEALQEYVLICCQNPTGGLIDKPNKHTDVYHTCYTLSGLSVAQHSGSRKSIVVGSPDNELATIHPLYNIGLTSTVDATLYFQKLPVPKYEAKSENV